jgi:hypothetical protein
MEPGRAVQAAGAVEKGDTCCDFVGARGEASLVD